MGSKNRIAKDILPIMLAAAYQNKITTWVEPFVGGGNMIDKVPSFFRRIGIDYNPHTIQALIAIRDHVNDLPNEVCEKYYNSLKGKEAEPISSLIRFGASFGGKFENGFARGKDNDGNSRDYWQETINNAKSQSKKLQGVELIHASYDDYNEWENCLMYCDPPYQNSSGYATGTFDHDKFWEWARQMSKKNTVFVSEYNAPPDFKEVWKGSIKTNFASSRTEATHKAIEKLFCLNTQEVIQTTLF